MSIFEGFDDQIRDYIAETRTYSYGRIQTELDFLLTYFNSMIEDPDVRVLVRDKLVEMKEKIKIMEIEELKWT